MASGRVRCADRNVARHGANPMAQGQTESWLTRGLKWLVTLSQKLKGKLGVYLALIVAFWTALAAFPKSLDPLLPPFPQDRLWVRNWLGIGIGLGIPTAIL